MRNSPLPKGSTDRRRRPEPEVVGPVRAPSLDGEYQIQSIESTWPR